MQTVNHFVSMDKSCIIIHKNGVLGTPGSVLTHLPAQTSGCVSFKLHLAVTLFFFFQQYVLLISPDVLKFSQQYARHIHLTEEVF